MRTSHLQLFNALVSLAILVFLFFPSKMLFLLSSLVMIMACFILHTRDGFRDLPPPDLDIPVYVNISKVEEVTASSLDELSSSWRWKYDVFLSFRGLDTRNKFVSHLYRRLTEKGINVFKDDRALSPGHNISDILSVIEKSRISIIVISKNFAFSSFCLDELVKIIKCKDRRGQIVLPIFYELDPSDVEEHKGAIAEAFQKHERIYDAARVRRWRKSLSTVARIVGWESLKRFDGNEANLIDDIYKFVNIRILAVSSTDAKSHRSHLVDVDSRMEQIDKLLELRLNDKRLIGIWGLGGVGKTTIAEEIVNRYAIKFESYCFLKNVKDKYEKKGDTYLQKKLLDQALNGFKEDIRHRTDGCKLIQRRLRCKKILVVLDDVEDVEQFTALAGSLDWFGEGSRVIVTTRDIQLLEGQGVHHTYEVPFLNHDMARKLFSIHAFRKDQPQKGYESLIDGFVTYAKGLPLALVVLGQSLQGWSIDEWQSEFSRLRRFHHPKINQVLRISYDRLKDKFTKEVFLDIAFFFIGRTENELKYILRREDCSPLSAIRTLKDKALLIIDFHNQVYMHDLIQEMAQDIVKETSESLHGQCSRLSGLTDVASMLRSRRGTSMIEGILLPDMSKIKEKIKEAIYLEADAFNELDRLRILDFRVPQNYRDKQVFQPCGDRLHYLSPELVYFRWDSFPFKYWPSIFIAENLVEFRLQWSKVERLWSQELVLEKLKVIDLSDNKCLKTFPNLSKAPNIKKIEFNGCESLIEFASDLQHLTKVKHLNFMGCKGLDKLPLLPPNLTTLQLPEFAVTELSSQLKSLRRLEVLKIGYYNKELASFSMASKPSTGAAPIKRLLKSVGKLKSVEYLRLIETSITELPQSIGKWQSLRDLILHGVPLMELPSSIEHLRELDVLDLSSCVKLVRLPNNMHKLTGLRKLNVQYCKLLRSLPQLPESLKELTANFCEALKTLEGDGWDRLRTLEKVSFVDCNRLDHNACKANLEHIKVNVKDSVEIQYVYPGKKIPSWFHKTSEGSSITLKLPSHQFWVPVFCVVYVVDQYPPDHSYFNGLDKMLITAQIDFDFSFSNPISIQSQGVNHNVLVWWSSDPQNNFVTGNTEKKIEVNFSAWMHCNDKFKEAKEVKVRRCGVHIASTFKASEEPKIPVMNKHWKRMKMREYLLKSPLY